MNGARVWIALFLSFLCVGLLAATLRRDRRLTGSGLLETERNLRTLYKSSFAKEGLLAFRHVDIVLLSLAAAQLALTLVAGIGLLVREAVGVLS